MQLFPVGRIYDFMKLRGIFVSASALMVLGSLILLVAPGPRLGTDFQGGTELEIDFKKNVSDEQVRSSMGSLGFSSPDVIRVAGEGVESRFMIRVQDVSTIEEKTQQAVEKAFCLGAEATGCSDDTKALEIKFSPGGDKITARFAARPDLDAVKATVVKVGGIVLRDGEGNPFFQNERESKVEIQLKSTGDRILDGLRNKLGADTVPEKALRVEWVGPKAGAQLRDAALKSIAIALVFVMMYIAFRFDLRFSPGAIIALIHDSIVTLGILVILQKELTLSTVAAVLTIVGYSVNDTVVVYDRVRENLGKMRGASFDSIINTSLSEMLSRTVLTSCTTIVSLSAFFIWGTGAVKDFALTIVIGLILGTYSSIYVALPLTHWLDVKFFTKQQSSRSKAKSAKRPTGGAVV